MFPFAFGAPLASRENSPAISRQPSTTARPQPQPQSQPQPQLRARSRSCSSHCSNGSYSHKKAHWRCKLRQVHPFISKEPHAWCRQEPPKSGRDDKQSKKQARLKQRRCRYLRYVLLFAAVLLSVAVLAIGLVYANLVSKPQIASQPAVTNTTGASRASLVSTTVVSSVVPTRSSLAPERRQEPPVINTRPGVVTSNSTRQQAGSEPPSEDANTQAVMDAAKERYSSVISVFFYVATLPIVTIVHVFGETLVALILARLSRHQPSVKTSPSVADDDDSFCDSDTETLHNEEKFKHELAFPNPPVAPAVQQTPQNVEASVRLEKAKRYVAVMSIISSILILFGWIITGTVQVHCELVSFGDREVCPPQTQLKRMPRGNSNVKPLSISRSVLSGVIVLVYLVQIFVAIRQSKFLSSKSISKSESETDGKHGHDLDQSSEYDVPPPYQSPPHAGPGILVRSRSSSSVSSSGRSRSNSTRRKTVRFDLEEASRRQTERGEDVQYIPAPGADDYGYSLGHGHAASGDNANRAALGYGLSHGSGHWAHGDMQDGWAAGTANMKTPWQWQGRFEDFEFDIEKDELRNMQAQSTSSSPKSSPTYVIARKPLPAGAIIHTKDQVLQDQMISQGVLEGVRIRGGSFDFGLTAKPVIRVVEAEISHGHEKECVVEIVNELEDENPKVTKESAHDKQGASLSTPPALLRQSAFSDTTMTTTTAATPATTTAIFTKAVSSKQEPMPKSLDVLPATTYTPSRPAPSPPAHPLASHPPDIRSAAFPFTSMQDLSDSVSEPDTSTGSLRQQVPKIRAVNRLKRSNSADDVDDVDDIVDVDTLNGRITSTGSSVVTLSAILSDYGARSSRLGSIAEEM